MILLRKGDPSRLTRGLKALEFECHCAFPECRVTIIDRRLIKAYRRFRTLIGVPLKINSGYRCPRHNMETQGATYSRHLTGQAIDISLKSLDHLTHDDIEHAARTSGFTFVKFYKAFVHMDVR